MKKTNKKAKSVKAKDIETGKETVNKIPEYIVPFGSKTTKGSAKISSPKVLKPVGIPQETRDIAEEMIVDDNDYLSFFDDEDEAMRKEAVELIKSQGSIDVERLGKQLNFFDKTLVDPVLPVLKDFITGLANSGRFKEVQKVAEFAQYIESLRENNTTL